MTAMITCSMFSDPLHMDSIASNNFVWQSTGLYLKIKRVCSLWKILLLLNWIYLLYLIILLLCLFYFYLYLHNPKHFLTCRLLHTCTHTSVHLYSYHAAIHTTVDIWLPCIRTSFLLTETGRDPVVVEEREPLGSELTKMLWFCRTPVIITENANRYKK